MIQQFDGGRLISSVVSNATLGMLRSETREYDAHGRLWKTTDARNGTTALTYNDADQIVSIITPVPAPGQLAQTNITVFTTMPGASGKPSTAMAPGRPMNIFSRVLSKRPPAPERIRWNTLTITQDG
jgi:YD repeat-containing protein